VALVGIRARAAASLALINPELFGDRGDRHADLCDRFLTIYRR
jgi:hypothetical protein